jgi:hypothetical protein
LGTAPHVAIKEFKFQVSTRKAEVEWEIILTALLTPVLETAKWSGRPRIEDKKTDRETYETKHY